MHKLTEIFDKSPVFQFKSNLVIKHFRSHAMLTTCNLNNRTTFRYKILICLLHQLCTNTRAVFKGLERSNDLVKSFTLLQIGHGAIKSGCHATQHLTAMGNGANLNHLIQDFKAFIHFSQHTGFRNGDGGHVSRCFDEIGDTCRICKAVRMIKLGTSRILKAGIEYFILLIFDWDGFYSRYLISPNKRSFSPWQIKLSVYSLTFNLPSPAMT